METKNKPAPKVEMPSLEVWMITLLFGLLDKEFQKRAQSYTSQLDMKIEGAYEEAQRHIKMQSQNHMHPLGQVQITRDRLQSMMDVYNVSMNVPQIKNTAEKKE